MEGTLYYLQSQRDRAKCVGSAHCDKEKNLTFCQAKLFSKITLTLSLPCVTKTEFLLTIYIYNIIQTSDENREKFQLWDYYLIRYHILLTNIIRIVWQTVRRITNEILGVKGLGYVYFLIVSLSLINLCELLLKLPF